MGDSTKRPLNVEELWDLVEEIDTGLQSNGRAAFDSHDRALVFNLLAQNVPTREEDPDPGSCTACQKHLFGTCPKHFQP